MILNHLSNYAIDLLEVLLGIFILGSGALLIIHPHLLKCGSSNFTHLIAGSFGGLLSGLFGVGGPPLIMHIYLQPLPFPVMRTTMLAILGIMTLIRIAFEGYNENITGAVLKLSLLSVPVSVLATLFARRFSPPIS